MREPRDGGERVGDAIPAEPRVELRGDVGRILAREHRQHFVERRAGERVVRVRRRTRSNSAALVQSSSIGDDRDDDLREHVERVLDDARRLDVAVAHRAHDGEHLHRVVAKRRDEHAAAHRVERMPGAPDALQSVGDALRRLQLQHEVDRADVDPQLERARADRARAACRP